MTPITKSKLSYETVKMFWERYEWQPFNGYIIYVSPNNKYRALINDQLGSIALIVSRNKILMADKRSLLMLFALFYKVPIK